MRLFRFREAAIELVIPGRVEDANLRCAIAHRGISIDYYEIPGMVLRTIPE